MKTVKNVLFGSILVLLLLPVFQQFFKIVKEPPLFGSFEKLNKVTLDSLQHSNWLDGSFQTAVNQQTEAGIGFHNTLVRLYNQWQFSLFSKANAEGVIVGQQSELFEEDYLRAATGEFFIGEEVWQQKAEQLKAIQDTLKSLGKTIMVIVEPGKGTVYSDRYPNKYQTGSVNQSNYKSLKMSFEQNGINLLDYNECFRQWRDTSTYRLFPRTGTHWSYYGAVLAADTLVRILEAQYPERIHSFSISKLHEAEKLKHPDDDIWLTMNLLKEAPVENIAYPELLFEPVPENGLNLLVIGDSFYFNWQNEKIILNTFSDSQFWYYNKLVHNHVGAQVGLAKERDLRSEIDKSDLILIMITERFHQNFAWGFDNELYELFYPGRIQRKDYFLNQVRIGNLEFIRIYNDAKTARMPLQERLALEAKFRMFDDWQKHPELYTDKNLVIEMLMMAIKGSPDWYAGIQKKAKDRKISDDEMLRIDAEWVYEQKQQNKKPS